MTKSRNSRSDELPGVYFYILSDRVELRLAAMDIARKTSLERELNLAKEKLAAWVKTLDSKGVESSAQRRDPTWRSLNAKCRQLKGRLRVVSKIEENDANVARLKSEKAAGVNGGESPKAEKPEKKAKDKSKAKSEKKAKA